MTVKQTRVTGRVKLVGTGEAAVDIPFPVRFTERPIFTFGAELDENQAAVIGNYPTVSGFVGSWVVVGRVVGGFDGYYVGARLLIVLTGEPDMISFFDWAMEAAAMRNPLNDVGPLTNPL
jgi:hypothetical protein